MLIVSNLMVNTLIRSVTLNCLFDCYNTEYSMRVLEYKKWKIGGEYSSTDRVVLASTRVVKKTDCIHPIFLQIGQNWPEN